MENCRLRPLTEEDHPFLYNSWLKSYRFSLFAERITNTIYFEDHHKLIEKILNNSKILIACNPSDPSQLYGYVVAGEDDGILIVHFLYVKHTFRNMGIGKTLLDAVGHSSDKPLSTLTILGWQISLPLNIISFIIPIYYLTFQT